MFFTKLIIKNDLLNSTHQVKKILLLGVVSMLGFAFNTSVFAESVIESLTQANTAGFEQQASPKLDSVIGDDVLLDNALTDSDMSDVSGMGLEAQRLEAGTALAVILWDERGRINPRHDDSSAEGKGNLQNVSVTVTVK